MIDQHTRPGFDGSRRLKRGAAILIAGFWSVHFFIQWIRNELHSGQRSLEDQLDGDVRRIVFALAGALVAYLLYRCLKPLRLREFVRQAPIGAAMALGAACIQAALNTWMFNADADPLLATYIYFVLYWFWFYFSLTTAYLAMAYSITVQEQERQAADLAIKAQEAQVRALRYQINPHFLFNTLNAIAALVEDKPERAEEMLVQLSAFFRRSLAIDPMQDVTLAQEVELQSLYLDIERTRFPDRLKVDVVLADDTRDALLPALILQPLVENAVKHGVARSEAATRIAIRSRRDGPMLEVVVEDDAVAASGNSSGEKVGLANVADRLRSLYGDRASLTSTPLPEGGYRNLLRLPLVE